MQKSEQLSRPGHKPATVGPRTAARQLPQQAASAPVNPLPMVRKPVLGAKAVGSFVPRLTRTAFEKFGFSAATLITDWVQIVGPDLARATAPERLKWPKGPSALPDSGNPDQGRPGATLVLRVDDGRALDIQYKTTQIIERINAYFGYRAVAEIRILQAPIKRKPAAQVVAPISNEPPPPIVAAIENAGLRDAFTRMAAGLKARSLAAKARR